MDNQNDPPKTDNPDSPEYASGISLDERKHRIEEEMESRIQAYTEESEAAVRDIERSIEEARQDLSRFKEQITAFEEHEERIRSQSRRVFALVADNKKRMTELARQSLEEISTIEDLKASAEMLITQERMEAARTLKPIADKYGLSLDWEAGPVPGDEYLAGIRTNMTSLLELLEGAPEPPEGVTAVPEPEKENEPGQEPPAAETGPDEENGFILVVEDDPITARILEHFLAVRKGFRVETASEAGQAQRGLERRPDLLLVNIAFPGMDVGIFTARAVKGDPPIPTIVLGSYDEQPALQQAVDKGAAGFLTKPISVDDLMKMVQGVLDPGKDSPSQTDL
jgi:CheY-like chemotaxis protein